MTAPLTKRCTICREPKELRDFHKDKYREDGRVGRCKLCLKALSALSNTAEWHRAYRLANTEQQTHSDEA